MSDEPNQFIEGDPTGSENELARVGERILNLKGCAPILIIAVVIITVVIAVVASQNRGDDKSSTSTQTPSATPPPPSESASESVPPAAGEKFEPPDQGDLLDGAQLFTGTSGDQIGCITCDGQFRFLHIERPGVTVGVPQEIVWPRHGQFLEFGANITGPNHGRYGYNLFANGETYMAGCAMEIGQTSCLQQRPNPVTKGDRITIMIGEAGTTKPNSPDAASVGDFVVNWWFVFQPDID